MKKFRKTVLNDHKKYGSKFITPVNHLMGNIRSDVAWIDKIFPELIWLIILIENLGLKQAIKVSEKLALKINEIKQLEKDKHQRITMAPCMVSYYANLSKTFLEKLIEELDSDTTLHDLSMSLNAFVNLYPEYPLLAFVVYKEEIDKAHEIDQLKIIFEKYFYRREHCVNCMEATANYICSIAMKIYYAKDVIPPKLNFLIEKNPDSDEYKKTAASVRAGLNMYCSSYALGVNQITDSTIIVNPEKWQNYFWDRGFLLDKCIFRDIEK